MISHKDIKVGARLRLVKLERGAENYYNNVGTVLQCSNLYTFVDGSSKIEFTIKFDGRSYYNYAIFRDPSYWELEEPPCVKCGELEHLWYCDVINQS